MGAMVGLPGGGGGGGGGRGHNGAPLRDNFGDHPDALSSLSFREGVPAGAGEGLHESI